MDKNNLSLLSSLIGLSYSCENEKEENTNLNKLILSLVDSLFSPLDECELSSLKKKIEEEKRILVPSCFSCTEPCGHNSDYDLSLFDKDSDDVKLKRESVISKLYSVAHNEKESEDRRCREIIKALIFITFSDVSFLNSILDELDRFCSK